MELLRNRFASFAIMTFMFSAINLGSFNMEVQIPVQDNCTVKKWEVNDAFPDVIQDSISAIKIGITILGIIYGEKYIKNCKPYYAKLINNKDTWKVSGSLHKKFTVGGEPIILLHKRDARVIKVYHTR